MVTAYLAGGAPAHVLYVDGTLAWRGSGRERSPGGLGDEDFRADGGGSGTGRRPTEAASIPYMGTGREMGECPSMTPWPLQGGTSNSPHLYHLRARGNARTRNGAGILFSSHAAQAASGPASRWPRVPGHLDALRWAASLGRPVGAEPNVGPPQHHDTPGPVICAPKSCACHALLSFRPNHPCVTREIEI